MKKLKLMIIVGLLATCQQSPAQERVFEEHISRQFDVVDGSTLAIYNVFGSIDVEGYDGNRILLEIDKKLIAENANELAKAKEEFKLNFDQKTDSLIVFIKEPRDSRPDRNYRNWEHKEIKYTYHLEFKVKVPRSLNLVAVTVNDGEVLVRNVDGKLKIHNVNGGISLTNVSGITYAHTVNGDVDITYASQPKGESSYYTLNGDLTVFYPQNLSADCDYKSFNGELFTDFPEVTMLPTTVSKNIKENDNTIRYKLESNTRFRIGNGGSQLHFETFNGNVYIKQKS
ncbi:DUF4097 family beta strand repeat-containing protein [Jiulongibacter sediminis]|uniref:DUF4097 domain-containing protein n=1 Tax=Jiulongibacter sediminis TaxID=1605367 RepID=A0A0P7BNA4_9BACT|nr:DUF4097 family beta strand repeat-containing protein [Jiulongibacter sediminis]KPM48727.1 hypothetical protein AFM12_09080 [Jiulongibacter sediminis]TBX25262.1 hypothetical protein TK44_09085 [Jiulongibacter sediminis]